MRAPPEVRSARIARILDHWEQQGSFHFTPAEREILCFAADGLTLLQIAAARRTALGTVRKQSKMLLFKTGDDSLSLAVIRLLSEAAALP